MGSSFKVYLGGRPAAASYSTNFDGTENPLSEGGRWSNITGNRAAVRSSSGYAYGTQTGSNNYDDSFALLSGTFPDAVLTASAVIKLISPDTVSGDSHEAELLFKFSQTSGGIAKGYECLLGYAGTGIYCGIAKWLGPNTDINQFYDITTSASAPGSLSDGDVFSVVCTVSGGNVSFVGSVNGSQIMTGLDTGQDGTSPYVTGQPGIGFFRRPGGTATEYGFNSYSVS